MPGLAKKGLTRVAGLVFLSLAASVSAQSAKDASFAPMTRPLVMSTGILTVLALWALWFLLDPSLRPEGLSWTHLILWLVTPFGMYVVLYRHREPPSPAASPVGREGIVVQASPLEVEVFGSFWHARCAAGIALRPGDRVRVVERDGLTLVVERFS
jgi:membrane protein implicated in regulation of membrane protease activity